MMLYIVRDTWDVRDSRDNLLYEVWDGVELEQNLSHFVVLKKQHSISKLT